MTDLLGPYELGKVHCVDCMEALPQLPDGCVDLVLTDPPYGISWNCNYSRFSRGSRDKRSIYNDNAPFNPSPFIKFPNVILWGANHYADKLPPASWLVWDKRNADGTAFLSDAEMAWWNKGAGVYIKSISGQWHRSTAGGLHPTQKPISLMTWCIKKSKASGIILDPFMGSGTTGVAAVQLGRRFLGFEIDPEYCELANKRIEAARRGLTVKELEQGQQTLW